MSESKHSPAPWQRKRLDKNHSVIYDVNGIVIIPRMVTEPGTESDANAELVASAPSLLSDLEQLRKENELLKEGILDAQEASMRHGKETEVYRHALERVIDKSNEANIASIAKQALTI